MLPNLTRKNSRYGLRASIVLFCYLSHLTAPAGIVCSNFSNLFFSKLSLGMVRAAQFFLGLSTEIMLITCLVSSALNHFRGVLCGCSRRMMCWVAARRIIARVQDTDRWPLFGMQKVSNTVGFIASLRSSESAVVSAITGPCPFPAFALRALAGRPVNAGMKSLNVVAGKLWRVYIGFGHFLKYLSGLIRIAGLLEAFQRFVSIITHQSIDPLTNKAVV